jgi:hypothetical protein
VLYQCLDFLRHQCFIFAAFFLEVLLSGATGKFLQELRLVVLIVGLTGNGKLAAPLSL